MVLKKGRLTEGPNFLEFEVAQMLCLLLLSGSDKKPRDFLKQKSQYLHIPVFLRGQSQLERMQFFSPQKLLFHVVPTKICTLSIPPLCVEFAPRAKIPPLCNFALFDSCLKWLSNPNGENFMAGIFGPPQHTPHTHFRFF